MSVFAKFAKNVDLDGLKKDVAEALENDGGSFEDIPDGRYEMRVEKMEAALTKEDKPKLMVCFKVIAGDQKGRLAFVHIGLAHPFTIKKAIELMRAMDTGLDVAFEDFEQFETLIGEVAAAIEEQGLEFAVEKTTNDKGFTDYTIEEVFDGK
jgi:hypothetical protein